MSALSRNFEQQGMWEEARKKQDRMSSSCYKDKHVKLIRHEVQVASLGLIFLKLGPEISPRWIQNLFAIPTDYGGCFQRCQLSWTFNSIMLWVSRCQSCKMKSNPLIFQV